MKNIDRIEAALTDDKGCLRDVNFLRPTWSGVKQLLLNLDEKYSIKEAVDGEGRKLDEPSKENAEELVSQTGHIHIVYRDAEEAFTNFQVFIASEENAAPFVELSFDPFELETINNLTKEFLSWVLNLCRLLQAEHYYVRYESVAWNLGDVSENSGIIYHQSVVSN